MFARQTKIAVYKNEEKINTNVDKTIIGFHLCDLVKFNPPPSQDDQKYRVCLVQRVPDT